MSVHEHENEPNKSEETLPFSKPKQEALLGHLLTDEKFFLLARHRIRQEWWTDPRLGQLWGITMQFAQRHNRAPKATEIADCPQMCALDLAEQNRLRSVLHLAVERRMDYGLDALAAELTDWLHARIYIAAMKKSEALFNAATKSKDSQKFQEAYQTLKAMNREIDETTFEPGHVVEMDDPVGDFLNQKRDAENAISFGLPALDRLLLPEGEGKGSLLRGDMTVLLAPTNIGKTTTMISVAAWNILQGKDVLLVTHEGRTADIKLKIWQSLMGLSRHEVMSHLADPEFQAGLAVFRDLVHKHLEFLPLNKAGMTVEEVEAIIRRRQDRWMATHSGKGFDLVVDDYAAKLTTQMARGGQWALRQIQEIAYNYFSQIALEHNLHVLTSIQTNREGSKENRRVGKNVQHRLLTMEDVMEAWGPMTTATNVISINRDPQAQARGIVTFYICKSRSSEVGWAVVCKSDYAAARSHWGHLEKPDGTTEPWPCTWYRGTSSMSEKIEDLLASHQGKEIPFQVVLDIENSRNSGA